VDANVNYKSLPNTINELQLTANWQGNQPTGDLKFQT